MINSFLKKYLYTFIPFLILDAIWLGLVAPSFYKTNIGHLMTDSPNFIAAGLFYLLYVAGLVVFVTGREGNMKQAALRGAFFGLLCYATYDLTNLATLRDWPVLVTVVDLLWGTFVSTVTSVAAVWLIRKFNHSAKKGAKKH
ncbi:membrane protein [Leptolinea sp. HRD-7]|nr:membrane protein [Leptolinea sp. HRD-7]